MAKPTIPTNKKGTLVAESEKTGFLKKLFMLFFIPVLFGLAVILVIAQLTDINVFESINKLTNDGNEENVGSVEENQLVFEEKVVTLQAQIQEKEAQIVQLQSELDSSASETESLLIEQERLLEEIALLQRQKDDTKRDFNEIVSTFEQMSSKSAAPVLNNMSDAEALRILTNLKPDIFPDKFSHQKLKSDEGMLLCSDGLLSENRTINNEMFTEKLKHSENPKEFVENLIDYAFINGSNDNITCITCWNSNL